MVEAEVIEQSSQIIRKEVHGVGAAVEHERGLTEPAQVRSDSAPAGREPGQLRVPHAAVKRKRVDEEYRFARTLFAPVDRCVVDNSLQNTPGGLRQTRAAMDGPPSEPFENEWLTT